MEKTVCRTAKAKAEKAKSVSPKSLSKAYSQIEIENLRNHRSVSLMAQVGKGDIFLSVPKELAEELGYDLQDATRSNAFVVNGVRKRGPMIGPIRIKIGNRYSDLSAIVQGREPMLCGVSPEILHDACKVSLASANDNHRGPSAKNAA